MIERVTQIVAEHTGREAIFLEGKSHEDQKASRNSCCWSTPLVIDGFEISVCQPSVQSKGNKFFAFFTFKKI